MTDTILGVMTGSVACTSCGDIPGATAQGFEVSPNPTPGMPSTSWRLHVDGAFYLVPFMWRVQNDPPCPRCDDGLLQVTDERVAMVKVQ